MNAGKGAGVSLWCSSFLFPGAAAGGLWCRACIFLWSVRIGHEDGRDQQHRADRSGQQLAGSAEQLQCTGCAEHGAPDLAEAKTGAAEAAGNSGAGSEEPDRQKPLNNGSEPKIGEAADGQGPGYSGQNVLVSAGLAKQPSGTAHGAGNQAQQRAGLAKQPSGTAHGAGNQAQQHAGLAEQPWNRTGGDENRLLSAEM